MSKDGQSESLTRADILKHLSEGEIASVQAADPKTHLRKGDQYLDLDDLQQGVQRGDGTATRTRDVLPRKAIHEDTWRRILRHLKSAETKSAETKSAET